MIAHNEVANHKYSRYFELIFKEYYQKQNDIDEAELVDLNETNPYALYDFPQGV